jgi:hypothetical protein
MGSGVLKLDDLGSVINNHFDEFDQRLDGDG